MSVLEDISGVLGCKVTMPSMGNHPCTWECHAGAAQAPRLQHASTPTRGGFCPKNGQSGVAVHFGQKMGVGLLACGGGGGLSGARVKH